MAAALLRRNPRLLNRAHFAAAAAAAAKPSSEKPDFAPASISRAKSAIRKEHDPDRVANLFESSSPSPLFHGDRVIYSVAVKKLSRARRPDLIRRILAGQLSDPSLPKTEGFFTRIISLYSDSGLVDDAVETFKSMPCPPTDRSLSAVFSALFDNRRLDRLREYFVSIPKELGVTPGVASYNVVLRSYCSEGDLASAHHLFDEMSNRGVEPNIISYNTLLSGYLKKGDENGFEEVLKSIREKGLEFNLYTYNYRISALCMKGKSHEAEELLSLMVSKGSKPDQTSYGLVIDAFCKEGDLKSALRVFKMIQPVRKKDEDGGVEEAVLPSSKTCNVLISSLVDKGEFGSALEIARKCLKKKWIPPLDAMKGLLDGLVKSSQVGQARDIVKKMRRAVKGEAADAWKKVVGELAL